MLRRQTIGSILVAEGYLTREQLQECIDQSVKANKKVGDLAVEKGYISERDLYKCLERQLNVPYVDLPNVEVKKILAQRMPSDMARRNSMAPVKQEGNILYIAIEDPNNFRALTEARTISRLDVRPMLAPVTEINNYIQRLYGGEAAQQALKDFEAEFGAAAAPTPSASSAATNIEIANSPVVRMVNSMLERAVTLRASDIHVEALQEHVRVRMRVDGVLFQEMDVPMSAMSGIIARLKILAELNIAEHRVPQDGRFAIKVSGKDIDIRLSTIATVNGEKAVMRLLDRSTFLVPKEKLGFTPENLKKFDIFANSPHGIVLVTGPTGSGKSTTLYTMLNEINKSSDNIVTVEDPVEFMMDGLNQMQVNPKAGVDFVTALRAILRQDPDVVMIGEMRDAETVEIAIKAAITGHLVLSTIHTNDAVSTITRLQDMGVPPYLIAASLVGVISQRLVRVICVKCKERYTPDAAELDMIGVGYLRDERVDFYRGKGCTACNKIGYKGRMAVHEIAMFDSHMKHLIHERATLEVLHAAAKERGMTPIKDGAIDLVRRGLTTLSEVSSLSMDI